MNDNPNVLMPDIDPPYHEMCAWCHRTLFQKDGRLICPECGFSVEIEETQPESKLVESSKVDSYLVQPGIAVKPTDIPDTYHLVKEDNVSPPQTRRRTYSSGDWDRIILT